MNIYLSRINRANIFVLSILFITAGVTALKAQDQNSYVISAKAGGINFVSGEASYLAKGESQIRSVTNTDTISSGDRLMTSPDGRVELLLNPGGFLRLSGDSEIEMVDASLDSLSVALSKGTAIIEIAGSGDSLAPVTLRSGLSVIVLDRKGVYRVQAPSATDSVTVRVFKGKARVNGEEVKDGREISVLRNGEFTTAKFDTKQRDDFDLWSSSRAETLASLNGKLSKQTLGRLSSSYRNDPFGRRGLSGYWLSSSLFGTRTFLPYHSGWSSPYGFGYHRHFGFSNSGFSLFGRRNIGFGVGSHRVVHRPVVRVVHKGGRRH